MVVDDAEELAEVVVDSGGCSSLGSTKKKKNTKSEKEDKRNEEDQELEEQILRIFHLGSKKRKRGDE